MSLIDTASLRNKTFLTLLALNGLTVLAAIFIGMLSLDKVRDDMGRSYASSRAQIGKQQMLGTLLPELALSRRLADSVLTRQWAANESDAEARRQFFLEAEGYRGMLESKAYFIALKESGHFYHNDDKTPFSDDPRYTVNPDNAADAWFFATLSQSAPYNINVDMDRVLKKTKIWFNVPIREASGKPLGVTGSGLQLQVFLDKFIHDSPPGVTAMMLDRRGLIQAHPDPELIEYNAVGRTDVQQTLHRLMDDPEAQAALDDAMERLRQGGADTAEVKASLGGQPHLIGLAYIPEIEWFVVSAVDMNVFSLFDNAMIVWATVAALVLLLVLLLLTLLGFDRLVLLPLAALTRSVRELGQGNYEVQLKSTRSDELGELARTFDQMARHVQDHTRHLEERVAARTRALEEAHEKIDVAHKVLTESIDAARLFQSALLPNAQTLAAFPGKLSALWLPRDVIGGDLYVLRPEESGCLIVLMDCAGHGVPGAFMTMIAHAALDVALTDENRRDPARLLLDFDETLRHMVPARQRFGRISSDMDMAVCYLDFAAGQLVYAGARLPLRWLDAAGYHTLPAARRNVGGSKRGEFSNAMLPLDCGTTVYLCTDGVLDQHGGERGFSLGEARLRDILEAGQSLPLAEQTGRIARALDDYRGPRPQRDDVTVIAFRVGASPSDIPSE